MLVHLHQDFGSLFPHLSNLIGRGGGNGQGLVAFRDDPVRAEQILDGGQRAEHTVGRHRLEDLLGRRIRTGDGLGN